MPLCWSRSPGRSVATAVTTAAANAGTAAMTAAAWLALLAGCEDPAAPAEDPCAQLAKGHICTYAGSGIKGFDGDSGHRLHAWMWTPWDITTDAKGTVYVTDWNNHRVRRIQGDQIQVVIGTSVPGDGDPELAEFKAGGADPLTVSLNHPTDMLFAEVDSPVAKKGQMLLTAWHNHRFRAWDPVANRISVTCGKNPGFGGDDQVIGPQTAFNQPSRSVQDAAGNTYTVDMRNWLIRKIGADKMVRSVAGRWGKPGGTDGQDSQEVPVADAKFLFFDPAEWGNPYFAGGGLALTQDGQTLYVADTGNHRIRKIDLVKGVVTTIAGSGANGCVDNAGADAACQNDVAHHPRKGGFGGDGGPAKAALLNLPTDLAWAPDGRLLFCDSENDRIRAIDLGTGTIATVAGGGPGATGIAAKPLASDKIGDQGLATKATLNRPRGLHVDKAGNLWIADSYNNRIRKVKL